jgi:plasmid maintenance system antidote protein VapI
MIPIGIKARKIPSFSQNFGIGLASGAEMGTYERMKWWQKLKECLDSTNVSQSWLARILEVDQSLVSKWIGGHVVREIARDHADKLRELFDPHDQFLFREDVEMPSKVTLTLSAEVRQLASKREKDLSKKLKDQLGGRGKSK